MLNNIFLMIIIIEGNVYLFYTSTKYKILTLNLTKYQITTKKNKVNKMYYCNFKVGYTMRDIRYFWRDGLSSVGMSSEVELPQFRVLGHRQRATEINLTTGTHVIHVQWKYI